MNNQRNRAAIAIGFVGVFVLVLIGLAAAAWVSSAFYRTHTIESLVDQVSAEKLGID